MKERCESISDVVANIKEIIDHEDDVNKENGAEYFFRGESMSHYPGEEDDFGTSFQSTLDRKGLVKFERDIYNDALRLNIADFREDSSMPERIARMQHYILPTRFADMSENALSALYFAVSAGYGNSLGCDDTKHDGFIRVMKVARKKMKQFNSDIIIAISHLPLVAQEQIDYAKGDGAVDCLRYEITNNRPGFGIDADVEIKRQLIKELRQVWAFRPIYNSRRLFSQDGLFLAFGCGNHKASLKPTFSPQDYGDETSPSCGIKQVDFVRIAAESKLGILNELRHYGMTVEKVYPELANVNGALSRKYEERRNMERS